VPFFQAKSAFISPFLTRLLIGLVSSILFVSLLIVGYGGGSGDNNNNNNPSEVQFKIGGNNNPSEVQFKTIIAGGFHSLALSNDGKVYAAGHNNAGQLGLGDETDRNAFTEVTSLSDKNIIAISAGYLHSLALSNDGKVYAAGRNINGQLGLGDKTDRTTFIEVTDLNGKNIIAISAGSFNSFTISNNGKVYATGDNEFSNLGLEYGDNTDRNAFVEVADLSGKTITALFAGNGHSLALSNDGKVYAVGQNSFGQLGLDDNADRNAFKEVTSLSDKSITAISAGQFHSLALSNNGKVYATGWNNYGQLGLGDNNNRNAFNEVTDLSDKNITALFAYGHHSLALSSDRKIYATGRNIYGQLGLGDITDRDAFTEVTSLSGKNITALSEFGYHSLALTNDGKIYAAGRNDYGQLGLGNNQSRNTFTKVTVWDD
jgi:alpha-tubulin suppressor-like RCC1 family protein